MYKLIALDLDGTTLNSQQEIQQGNIDAIRYARSKGVKVVVATGRIVGEAAEFVQILGADTDMITSGGSVISDATTAQSIERNSIPWQSAATVAEILERLGVTVVAYVDTKLIMNPYSDDEFGRHKKNLGFKRNKLIVDSVADEIKINQYDVDKFFSRSSDPQLLEQAKKELQGIPYTRVTSSASNNIEVILETADKGSMLKRLCDKLDIDISETIAIGDSDNDTDMLKVAGLPIAMENAPDETKALVRHITDTNDNDGVAKAIYKFIK